MLRPPPRPTLFPYTTLFRSRAGRRDSQLREMPRVRPFLKQEMQQQAESAGEHQVLAGELHDLPNPGPVRRVVAVFRAVLAGGLDRKSTRLNSSHSSISYAVF